jgi:hypothetical protein
MRLEDYTPDNVCRAMGLPSLTDDPSLCESEALRVVFLPSFHPEVTLTFRPSGTGVEVSIVALQSMLWHEPSWARLPEATATFALESQPFVDLAAKFDNAYSSTDMQKSYLCIDGMNVAACRYSGPSRASFKAHCATSEAVHALSVDCVRASWEAASGSQVAVALADIASYLGIEYPRPPAGPEPAMTKLLILGTAEERKQYFDFISTKPEA